MAKYEVDLSAWLIVEAKSEDEAFDIGQKAIAELHKKSKDGGILIFDGEVAGVTESEEDD